MVLCLRCRGRKKMYKMGSGYSTENTGGPHVNCPLCLGVGKIKKLSQEETTELINSHSVSESVSFNMPIRGKTEGGVEDLEIVSSPDEPLQIKIKTKTVSKSKGKTNAKKESRAGKA